MLKKLITKMRTATRRQMLVAGAFTIAMVAAAGLGLASRQDSSAAVIRECDNNAILRCGAADAKEFIADIKVMNTRDQKYQGDLTMIYDHFGLSRNEYDRFEKTARQGLVYRDGRVVVDGQVVMTKSESIGRQKFNAHRMPYKIGNNTYYTSQNDVSYGPGVNSISAMVMFDANGEVEAVVMNPCGNPVHGEKVKNKAECKSLNKVAVANKLNTYKFNTTVFYSGNVSVKSLTYDFGDGKTVTTTNPSEYVEHTFTKASTVTVTVTYNVPGKQTVSVKCTTNVTFVAPFYTCDAVQAVALNDKKTQFRFTVKTTQRDGATLKDADFTLDGKTTTTGVTTKDANGNIYKDYTFAEDGAGHKVVVKVNFNLASGVASKTCEASVTAGKTPMCPVPGKEHLPADSPECVENCPVPGKTHLPKGSPDCVENCPVPGKTHLPKNSPECVENCPVEGKTHLPKNSPDCVETPPVTPPTTPPAELPKTGIGSVLGIFAGTTAFGAIAHGAIRSMRARGNQ